MPGLCKTRHFALASARHDFAGARLRYFGLALPGWRCVIVVACSLFYAAPALAQDCGSIVIPPGLGIGPGADVTSLNPLLTSSLYNQEAAGLIFQPLLWVNRYHEIDYARSIASAVTSSPDGKIYDVVLRPWAWSDGVAVTSTDVLYAFALIEKFGPAYAAYGQGGMPDIVASITAPDATHVHVVLKRAVNPQWFILNGLSQLMPLPQHVWARYSTDQIWQAQSNVDFFRVGDGPLLPVALNIGIDAVFVPNPLYALHGGARMHFSRFVLKFENAEGQELQAVQSGDLDMSNIPFDLYAKALTLPGDDVVNLPPSYSWHELIPNMANKTTLFFADVRVRQALADAIDQQRIVDLAMHGLGLPVHGPVPPYPTTFLSPAAKAGAFPVGYDPAKAKALLAAAGFVPGVDGVLVKNGQRLAFTLSIPAGQPLRIEIAESIQQDLQAVGISMQVRQMEFNQLLAAMVGQPQAWQAILIGMNLGAYPSGEELFAQGAALNNNGYNDAHMDQLIKQSTDAPGMDGLFAYQDYASAQQPVIFLPNERYSVLVRKGLHGVQDFLNPLGAWAPEKLYCTGTP
jgi:peptide/nickel transport system substrate-binding protein